MKRIIPQCIARDFTDLIVINEDRKIPSILCVYTKLNAVLALGYGETFFLQCVCLKISFILDFFLHCAVYRIIIELKITVPTEVSDD